MKKYITTPIYYVNDTPHIGHAYTTVAADVLARYWRLRGAEVFFLTGTDEHGAKISAAAKSRGKTPAEFCDEVSAEFRRTWDRLGIKYDRFIRTTEEKHVECVRAVIQELYDRKQIYKSVYRGLYCDGCEKFLAEDELVDGLCPDHNKKPDVYDEENYFFKLSLYRDKLVEMLTSKGADGYIEVMPEERRNEILGKLKQGLDDISISRSKVDWGIPLPFDENQSVYVWVDALINYISAANYAPAHPSEKFAKLWPADCHLMAKDILWFHAVIWPAILMALGIKTPRKLVAHGFFTINGQKMSKTLGNIIRPSEMIDKYGADAARYLLLSLFPFGADGDISWDALTKKYNTDLANNIGNLVNRTLTMVEKYYGGKIPEPAEKSFDASENLSGFGMQVETLEFHSAIASIQSAVDAANKYIQEKQPWALFSKKDPELDGVIYGLVESLGVIAIHLQIFMPNAAEQIWQCIGPSKPLEGATKEFFEGKVDFLTPGSSVKKLPPLFPRIGTV